MASTLTNAYSRVNDYATPKLNSPDPQVRREAHEYLARSADLPPEHAETFKELGLDTNRDVLDKAPEYAENLNKAADDHDREAKFQDGEAAKAEAAAKKMDEFAKTLDERENKIHSVSDQKSASSDLRGRGSYDSSLEAYVGDGATSAKIGAAGGSNADPFSDPRSKPDGSAGKGGAVGGESSADSGARKNASSLSDRLRESLSSAADGKDGRNSSSKEPSSAFDSIFEGGGKGAGKDGRGLANFGAGLEGGANGKAFTMAGSETDQAVNHLLQNLSSQWSDSEKSMFGSIDQTIFARMTKYLTKAQADKRVH